MKTAFLLLIFNPPFGAGDRLKVAKIALDLKYTMFSHNGIVYDVQNGNELFNLSDLIQL